MLQSIAGYVGLSLLVDRTSGRCIATTAWESEDAMRASGEMVQDIRRSAAEAFGGSPEIAEWEVATMHREHHSNDGACVRVTWATVAPEHFDRAIDVFKMAGLPALAEVEGLCSASLLVDRASGRGVTSVAYDSVETIQRNQDKLAEMRAAISNEAKAEISDECDFELAIAHLHVPEMV
jgi:heme-degrading monooxygenase HmoA